MTIVIFFLGGWELPNMFFLLPRFLLC
jgi:hypothetical protein